MYICSIHNITLSVYILDKLTINMCKLRRNIDRYIYRYTDDNI